MKLLHILISILFLTSCLTVHAQKMDTKSKLLLGKLTALNGTYDSLIALNDVQFSYTKVIHGNTKMSTEQLIFKGEHSLSSYNGEYKQEQGTVKRSSINGNGTMSINDEILPDEKSKKVAVYANSITFYWFTMMYKLSDPSTVSTYIGQETIDNVVYDKVKLVFDYSKLEKKSHDEYLLYFNPATHLVDLFMYSATNGDVIKDPKSKVFVTYKVIQGIHVPAIRKHFKLNDKGEWQIYGIFSFSNVIFDNGLSIEDFKL